MPEEPTRAVPGRSVVARRALSEIVRDAALGSYGVTGLAEPTLLARFRARLGLGINGINRVPEGAISLAEALAGRGFHPQATPARLEKLALRALERAIGMAGDAELVRARAEQRLWRPLSGVFHAGRQWQILGLERDGALRLRCQGEQVLLRRHF
jgi:hypothetical protein